MEILPKEGSFKDKHLYLEIFRALPPVPSHLTGGAGERGTAFHQDRVAKTLLELRNPDVATNKGAG